MNTRLSLVVAAGLSLSTGASACSVCIAHMLGAALHGIGAQVLPRHKLVVGLSTLTFDKSNQGDTPGVREFESYHETAIGLAYGLTDQLLVSADLPFVSKSIRAGSETQRANGLGDASLGLTMQLKPSDKQPVLTAFSLSVKLPTGEDSQRDAIGELKEQHVQVGTGSTDVAFGVAFTKESAGFGSGLWYGGLQARLNGHNSRGYQYGNAFFYNFGYSHPVGKESHASIELVGRVSAKDNVGGGEKDDNSGGHLLYLGVGFQTPLSKSLSLGTGWQVPIMSRLNGDQTERGVFTIGIAGRF